MAGPGDALSKEGRNMQKGMQDFHDMWMGQRPVPDYETHSIRETEELTIPDSGPQNLNEWRVENGVPPQDGGGTVAKKPGQEASAESTEPSTAEKDAAINNEGYTQPTYDPTYGPDQANDNEPGM